MSDRAALLEQKKKKLAELRKLRQKRYSNSNFDSNENIQNILDSIDLPTSDPIDSTTKDSSTIVQKPAQLTVNSFQHFELKLSKVKYEKSTQVQHDSPEQDDIEMRSLSDNDSVEIMDVEKIDLNKPEVQPTRQKMPLNEFIMSAAKKIENLMSAHISSKHVYVYDQIDLKLENIISCQFFRNDIVLTTQSGVYFRTSCISVVNITASLCHDNIYIGTEFGSIHVFDSRTYKEKQILDHHKYPIKQISSYNNTLCTLSEDGELFLWNTKLISEPIASLTTKPGALCMVKMHQYVVGCLNGMYSVVIQMNTRSQISDAKFDIDAVYSISAMNEFALTISVDLVGLWHIPVYLN